MAFLQLTENLGPFLGHPVWSQYCEELKVKLSLNNQVLDGCKSRGKLGLIYCGDSQRAKTCLQQVQHMKTISHISFSSPPGDSRGKAQCHYSVTAGHFHCWTTWPLAFLRKFSDWLGNKKVIRGKHNTPGKRLHLSTPDVDIDINIYQTQAIHIYNDIYIASSIQSFMASLWHLFGYFHLGPMSYKHYYSRRGLTKSQEFVSPGLVGSLPCHGYQMVGDCCKECCLNTALKKKWKNSPQSWLFLSNLLKTVSKIE